MSSTKEAPWSAEREFAAGRQQGRFPTVKRHELHLAGMSLSSVSNMPQGALPVDATQAPGALLDFVTGFAGGSRGERGLSSPRPIGQPAAGTHDFTEYLRQTRGWQEAMRDDFLQRATSADQAHDLASAPQPHSADSQQAPDAPVAASALQELQASVPALFFEDGFDIGDVDTFRQACPMHLRDETRVARRLGEHLDAVRTLRAAHCLTPCSTLMG